MNEKKYYFILCTSKGSIGIPYEPKPRSFNDFQWGQPLKKCENLEYELKDGGYVPLMESFCRGKLVTEEVKKALKANKLDKGVEYYPVLTNK